MSATKLSLATLGELRNGMARAVIDQALANAIKDTLDRGVEDSAARKVQITVAMKAVDEANVAIDVSVKTTVPEYATGSTIGRVNHDAADPAIEFQSDNADRPDQPTIPFEDKPKKEKKA